jgi:Lrp/AsnC family leucine-responsive transcriptional regulator
MANTSLDEIDMHIISILQTEGRISNLNLADRVNLSPTPCSRRVKRLEDSGVITGYSARINPVALGQGISVIITVRLAQPSAADIEDFLATVNRLSEITECLLVTGGQDYILKVRTTDVEALRDLVLKQLKRIPCISETATMLILDQVKTTS